MINKRIFVKKKKNFNIKEQALLQELKSALNLTTLTTLDYYVIYDIFFTSEAEFALVYDKVFLEPTTDEMFETLDIQNKTYLAVEALPNQFDKRAQSAKECVYLLNSQSKCQIKTGELLIFNKLPANDLQNIKNYYLNEIESQEKLLTKLELIEEKFTLEEISLAGFRTLTKEELLKLIAKYSLTLSLENLQYCQEYFQLENKDPLLGELKVIDTYWSDHCRHQTFNTILQNIQIKDQAVKKTYQHYLELRTELERTSKPITLMDLATIYGRYAVHKKIRTNIEKTEEDNAISLEFTADGKNYLYQFKNETHNHPTEIEPYGGAATCIGGAIRDPLSGRAFVYQGLRISGAASILEGPNTTLPGKLPQRLISQKAAEGFSAYGNQIGLATTYVQEIYHPSYKAKHLEAGAVVGVAKKANVLRAKPEKGDIILLLGGKTGYDGIGGATGSSKSHNKSSLETASVEVQKGNAIEEKKIQRLFMNKLATKLIKKCNDFGAGGVSVAIGELSPSITIYLDKIPLKVKALKPSDIALSESQERMAVVLAPENVVEFIQYAKDENLEATEVAKVTDDNCLKMYYEDKLIINLKRSFLDSNGVDIYQSVVVKQLTKPKLKEYSSLEASFQDENLVDNKNMELKFDATVGATTVLMPYGGKYQLTKEQVAVQKIPYTKNKTSHVAYGFNPYLMSANTYVGSQMAVIDSITKVIVSGVQLKDINLSFQEYFKRLGQEAENWGEITTTLLGALKAQAALQVPALGGKDSMSGTYESLHVPPTLISFAYGIGEVQEVISSTIKQENVGANIYLLNEQILQTDNSFANFDYLRYQKNLNKYEKLIEQKKIKAGRAAGLGGVAVALSKMLMGNKLGCIIHSKLSLYKLAYGVIIFITEEDLDFYKLGIVTNTKQVIINEQKSDINSLIDLNFNYFNKVYPKIESKKGSTQVNTIQVKREYNPTKVKQVKVFIPLFPGTNSELEMKKAFETAGAVVKYGIFKNYQEELISQSLEEFVKLIKWSDIIAIPGGFSGADEPDGSGKYIVNVLCNSQVKAAIKEHLAQDKLILGICNGFQALLKSGLIINNKLGKVNPQDPTLFTNNSNQHLSQCVTTKVVTTNSPWLKNLKKGDTYTQVISHGEGKFCVTQAEYLKLKAQDMIAFCYEGANPNGSDYQIEALISPCGKILGKMAHSERYEPGLYLNIEGNKKLNIFASAVEYFTK